MHTDRGPKGLPDNPTVRNESVIDMALVLRGVTLNEEPISQPLIGRFDSRGGTVGRSDDATLTLPDPERMISRTQARVLYGDEHYWIENVSPASALLHNGRPLSQSMRVVLGAGDEIRIGGYALEVSFEDDEDSATILRGRTAVPRPQDPQATRRIASPSSRSAPNQPMPERAAAARPVPERTALGPTDTHGTLAEPLRGSPLSQRATATPSEEPLWPAFLRGARVNLPLADGPTPELLASIGEMLRIAVDGIQRLVTMRARAKSEMQAEMTMIQVRDNNPLKFSPDASLALQMLLQPPARGFLPGPEALRTAVTDLQSHQIGMTAGMRSVLEAVLDRLDPKKLEAQSPQRSILDILSPARRRARLWDAYLKKYAALREEAQDNFQRFFGEVFRDAYEAQVRNLQAAADATGSRPGGAAR